MNAFKNGLVRVSTEFLTEVLITATEGRVPPDSVATGVYYDPSDDAFVFVIASELLGDREELAPLREVTQVVKADLARFFEGFTGRTWGAPMSKNDLANKGRETLDDFDKGEATEVDLRTTLNLIVSHFERGKS